MDIPDDPYRVAPPGTLTEDFADDYDAEADEADALNDAEWLADRERYAVDHPPGSACNSACGYCGRCS